MSKLTRVFQKIFGSTAGAGEIGKFGSLAAGSPVTTTDPVVVQALSNYLDGWFAAILGGNSPAIEDMNALHFLFARQLAYLFQQGVAEWDAETTYFIGSLVTSGNVLYSSLTNNNFNNLVSDPTNWNSFPLDLSITTAKLAAKAVTTAKIDDASVTGTQMASNNDLPGVNTTLATKRIVVSSAAQNLKIVCGVVDATGGIVSGEGFTMGHPGTGTWDINFTEPFTNEPAFTFTVFAPGGSPTAAFWDLLLGSASSYRINTFNSAAILTDYGFSFIAIGHR